MEDCLFCKILNGEIPSYKIYEDEYAYAFLDIAGDYYGHTVVVSKLHYDNVLDANEDVLNSVMCAVKKIANHYINNCGFSGVNICSNSGQCAGQSIMHLHFHIIPRKADDGIKDIYVNPDKHDFDLCSIAAQLSL